MCTYCVVNRVHLEFWTLQTENCQYKTMSFFPEYSSLNSPFPWTATRLTACPLRISSLVSRTIPFQCRPIFPLNLSFLFYCWLSGLKYHLSWWICLQDNHNGVMLSGNFRVCSQLNWLDVVCISTLAGDRCFRPCSTPQWFCSRRRVRYWWETRNGRRQWEVVLYCS